MIIIFRVVNKNIFALATNPDFSCFLIRCEYKAGQGTGTFMRTSPLTGEVQTIRVYEEDFQNASPFEVIYFFWSDIIYVYIYFE